MTKHIMDTITYRQNKLKKLKIAIFIIFTLLIILIVIAIFSHFSGKTIIQISDEYNNIQEVVVFRVGDIYTNDTIEVSGVVTADTKLDVVALAPGIVRELYFDVGNTVFSNQLLASLYDSAIVTNYETSKANFRNIEQSIDTTRALTEQSIKLAQITVEQSEENIKTAQISLETANSNLQTTLPIFEQQTKKAIQDQLIAYHTNLENVQNALDNINFIIRAKGTRQIENISSTLGINDQDFLNRARENWLIAKNSYDTQILKTISESTINERLNELIVVLDHTLNTANDTVSTLQYSTSNFLFSDSELETLRSTTVGLKTRIANNKSTVTNSLNSLSTLSSTQQKEQIALFNAIEAAKNQLTLAEIANTTARSQLTNSLRNQDQQILGAQTTLDSAIGQKNLAGQSVNDLSVRAPINGDITNKYIDKGTKVSAGQKIAEISQTDLVSIYVGLSQNDANRIQLGDVATIEKKYFGVINRIDNTADPFSRKISIEIIYDNSKSELIPETFVNVLLPLTPPQPTSKEITTLLVPIKAITITNSERYAFIVNNNIARKVNVTTGDPIGNQIEILSGLTFGDEIIIVGNKLISDGDEISVIK